MHALAQKRGSEESDGSGLLLVAAEMLRFQKIASLAAKGWFAGTWILAAHKPSKVRLRREVATIQVSFEVP